MSGALAKYDEACRAIAGARTVDAAKGIANQAEAMRVYARQSKNLDLEVHAAEIRLRAERRLGELIAAQKTTVGLAKGNAGQGRPSLGGTKKAPPKNTPPTLAEMDIDKKLSKQAQDLARVPAKDFEQRLDDWRATARTHGHVPKQLRPARVRRPRPLTPTAGVPPRVLQTQRLQEALDATRAKLSDTWDRSPHLRATIEAALKSWVMYFAQKRYEAD